MKKQLSPLLALLLLSGSTFSQESLASKIKLQERVSAFINPPTQAERKEDVTRLERAMRAVRDKWRRLGKCLSGKQACNKTDFVILASSLLY